MSGSISGKVKKIEAQAKLWFPYKKCAYNIVEVDKKHMYYIRYHVLYYSWLNDVTTIKKQILANA